MQVIRALLAAAAILGMVLPAAIGPGAASASTAPVVYAAQDNGWHAYVKPGSFYFGQGGSPYFTGLRWSSWNAASAWGTGRLWTVKPGCYPLYKCPYSSRWVGVYLNTVKLHGSTRYYQRMSVEFYNAGKWRWDTGYFVPNPYGGTVPVWKFPAVFPYL